ncbi:response regulator [Spirosoma sp. BT702]|uniref:Response regulator n=1 Tax=Spirosoma profusum TaxID=2771354 RepID=A0A927GAM9_9BACT|nr:response regulator [Spirosoma profusum]
MVSILVIDADFDQQLILGYHLRMSLLQAELVFSATLEETLLYLYHCFAGRLAPPSLVQLSLPKAHQESDWQLLEKLRVRHPRLPVVVIGADNDFDLIGQAYELGANSFIAKPLDLDGWERLCEQLKAYWFDVVTLPPAD